MYFRYYMQGHHELWYPLHPIFVHYNVAAYGFQCVASFVHIKYSFAAENDDSNLAPGRELIYFCPSVNPRVGALV